MVQLHPELHHFYFAFPDNSFFISTMGLYNEAFNHGNALNYCGSHPERPFLITSNLKTGGKDNGELPQQP